MDIMMPEMDGYETMQVIRQQSCVPAAADHRADGQSHEGRPGKVSGSGRFGIFGETGEHRAVAFGFAYVVASLDSIALGPN